jgi:hypothetical protein
MRLTSSLRSLMMLAVMLVTMCAGALAQVAVSVEFAPPPLPVYDQPLCPGEGYIWTPGFWAWDDDAYDYYWVPGTWVLAPEVGFLWTPPWWGFEGEAFIFHEGFWGPEVGFYGGISYGFGYFGHGYVGGRWQDGRFFYNREVNNINITNIRNVYNERVTINNENRVSYNGRGGVEDRPTPQEEAASRGRHLPPAAEQRQHIQVARTNPELRASTNRGKPPIAATPRPGALREGAVPAKAAGGQYTPPANRRPGNRQSATGGSAPPNKAMHPKDLPPIDRAPITSSGDPKRDQKLQQQQEKLITKQNQEREKLQQQQAKEHAKLAAQNASDQRKQQVEQRHQEQTQALAQKHTQQMQRVQPRPASPPSHGGKEKPH